MKKLAQEIEGLCLDQTPFVLVTLVNARGSAPQDVGAKMLVTHSGRFYGTVGGGRIEAHTIQFAQDLLKRDEKQAVLKTWNLQTEIGMSCGGEASLFFEVHTPSHWQIAIFGAGHVSQALCRLLLTLDCQITVYDSRREWLDRLPEQANLKRVHAENLPGQVSALPRKANVLCITNGHGTDLPILKEIFAQDLNFPFLAVIGSDTKAAKIRAELLRAGVPDPLVQSVICPIGLPIGTNSPPEIAVSIVSQLLAARDGKTFQIQNGRELAND